jgi:hypothetical protein
MMLIVLPTQSLGGDIKDLSHSPNGISSSFFSCSVTNFLVTHQILSFSFFTANWIAPGQLGKRMIDVIVMRSPAALIKT